MLLSEVIRNDCTCARCLRAQAVEEISVQYGRLSTEFGGIIPRQYHFGFLGPGVTTRSIRESLSRAGINQIESARVLIKRMLSIANKNSTKFVNYRGPLYFCEYCGRKHKVLRKTLSEGSVCLSCSKSNYIECSICGKYAPGDKIRLRYVTGSQHPVAYCLGCYQDNFFDCLACGESLPLAKKLMRKATFLHDTTMVSIQPSDIKGLCLSCFEKLKDCMGCGATTITSVSHDRLILCQQCASDYSSMKEYRYRPAIRPKCDGSPVRDDTLMCGFELEVEQGQDVPRSPLLAITRAVGPGVFYYKRDGSLRNGVEIVSHPFTEEWYKANRVSTLGKLLDKLDGCNFEALKTCGLHLHLTKRAFTVGHLYKFLRVLYSPGITRSFWIALSRRGGTSSYATFYDDDASGIPSFAKFKKNVSDQRYSAFNCCGTHTGELRIFASTIDKQEFFAAIESMFSLYNFTKDTSFRTASLPEYLNWLFLNKQNRSRYRWLLRELLTIRSRKSSDDECQPDPHRDYYPKPFFPNSVRNLFTPYLKYENNLRKKGE
jgi:hypothetical protein